METTTPQGTEIPTNNSPERTSYTTKKDRYLMRKEQKALFKSGNMASLPLEVQRQLGQAMNPEPVIGGLRNYRRQKEFNAGRKGIEYTAEKFIKLCKECKEKGSPMPRIFPQPAYFGEHLSEIRHLWNDITLQLKNLNWNHIENTIKNSPTPVYFITRAGKVKQFDLENPIKTIYHNPLS